jgi:citrate lyase subunit gamma (acyl carrier protein)
MQLVMNGVAGTLESGDILIEIQPSATPGIHINLKSSVENQFGAQIKRVIRETVESFGLDRVDIRAVDKGSLDCTIRARVTTAVLRGCNSEYDRW